MDPLTLAASGFLREHETAWSPPPAMVQPAILRLHVEAAHRGDALKALRLLEWQPDNRRPFSIVEEPFKDAVTFVRSVALQVRSDVKNVDEGLRADGVARPALPPTGPEDGTAGGLATELESLARHLAGFLDGLVVVLAPRAVLDPKSFVAFITELTGNRAKDCPLRLDVLACECPGLDAVLPDEARFDVNDTELFRYLRDLGTKSSAGPATGAPAVSPEQRKKIEAELGQPIVSLDAGRTLRHLLFDGGKALHEGRPKEAVRKYRAARMLAEATGLKNETLLTSMALGSAYTALQNYPGAQASFERARRIGEELKLPEVEAQALFGLGYVHMYESRYREAAAVYQIIASTVSPESPMRQEALRMLEAAKRGDLSFGLTEVSS